MLKLQNFCETPQNVIKLQKNSFKKGETKLT